jgi:hypothetical protein
VTVADGTAMTKVSTGVYEYSFTDAVGIAYEAYVEVVYDNTTHHFEHDIDARAADAGFQCDWDSIRKEVADYLGWTRDDSVWSADELTRLTAIVRSGLSRVYFPETVRPELAYHWSWMRPEVTIETVAAYTTGTVTIANGVVTFSVEATVPTWAAYGELTVGSDTYTVNTRDGDNQVTLDDTSVTEADASSYSLGRPSYELPSTFGGAFDGKLAYKPGTNVLWPAITIVSDQMIRMKRQHNTTADRPLYAAIRPASFEATTGQRWEIVFYPTPNDAYTLYGRYKIVPTMLDAVNKYPLGGEAVSEVIIESCLAVAEQRMNDMRGFHTEQFERLLAVAIANDADSHAPHTLGYNADRSDQEGANQFDEHAGVAIHSYDGTTYYD